MIDYPEEVDALFDDLEASKEPQLSHTLNVAHDSELLDQLKRLIGANAKGDFRIVIEFSARETTRTTIKVSSHGFSALGTLTWKTTSLTWSISRGRTRKTIGLTWSMSMTLDHLVDAEHDPLV